MLKIKRLAVFLITLMLIACSDNNIDLSGVYSCSKSDHIVLVKDNNNQYIGGEYWIYSDGSGNPNGEPVDRIKFLKKSGDYLILPSEKNKKFYLIGNNQLKVIDVNYDGYYENWCNKTSGSEKAKQLMQEYL
ncbi:hypothetical protein AB7196_04120 [Providencia rettgeri]